ncbi:YkvS family protein [Bacillus marinisedimentorum]|uniref:YkvS family protein n=1 Tax=Bacillus marinisedimentorum TaxID=1821260 RepID=UPI0007DF8B60|nr:YkvS family protein [Bacillus marinisedimentorum]
MEIAKIGDLVAFKEGMRGKVEVVYENSVIVDLTVMDNYQELDFENSKTVVNHKKYEILESV